VSALRRLIVERIRASGPITVADFMELALYHPEFGYYATAPQRSGRDGDFFTSVDVGPLFGELVAVQIDEMWRLLAASGATSFDLVEAAAGSGRLMRDILDAAAARHPAMYARARVAVVERSAQARDAQRATLETHAGIAVRSLEEIPDRITGVLVANELLDAMPVHIVVQRAGTLREIHIAERDGALHEVEGSLSTTRIHEHLDLAGASLEDGWRAEVGLAACDWTRRAADAIDTGFLLLFDYGHPARELYSASHATGTLTAYRHHRAFSQGWLDEPGSSDLTCHVDLTAVERAAHAGGMVCLGAVDQTYFVTNLGIAEAVTPGDDAPGIRRRLAGKTLLMPGGLGSTIKVMCFSKGVGRPLLRGLSSGRLT
jgi:SAM-dependent MidA family methyltransferase